MKQLFYFLLTVFFYTNIFAQGQVINVPGDQPTIQSAINASVDGDTVLVADGTYFENINYRGKAITVASWFLIDGDETHIDSTIINGSKSSKPDTGSVVIMSFCKDTTSVLYGFTITAGFGTIAPDGSHFGGGGIAMSFGGAKIQHNKIIKNIVNRIYYCPAAGGIAVWEPAKPVIITKNYIGYNEAISSNCTNGSGGISIAWDFGAYVLVAENVITNNRVYSPQESNAGGISLQHSNSVIRNNIIAKNEADRGAGIDIYDGENPLKPTILNNTIINNTANNNGGGINGQYDNPSESPIKNCIIWGNTAPIDPQISKGTTSPGIYDIPVEYSNIEGGFEGIGNIDLDPLFADTTLYYLDPLSPCVDAGNPSILFNDLEDENNIGFAQFPALGLLKNDMGAYGGNPNMIWMSNPNNYILNCSINNISLIPDIDTLTVTSEIFSPENQLVETLAIIESYDGSLRDSIPMFDDGTHNDNTAGDGFYTGYWPVTSSEKYYNIHISANLTDYEYLVLLKNAAKFTTIGPIKAAAIDDGYRYERQYIKLILLNEGSVTTAANLKLTISTTDPRVKEKVFATKELPDLAAGITDTSSFSYYFYYADGYDPDSTIGKPIQFDYTITSDEISYWEGSFAFTATPTVSVDDEQLNTTPQEFALEQNYPNPFNPSTTIKYEIPSVASGFSLSNVTLKVYDILGREVATLVNQQQKVDYYEVNWDAGNNSSGIYFYKLNAGSFVDTKKMILLR